MQVIEWLNSEHLSSFAPKEIAKKCKGRLNFYFPSKRLNILISWRQVSFDKIAN